MESHSSIAATAASEIAGRIHQFVLTTLLEGEDGANLTATTPLISCGIIDSINVLKVGLFLEKTFAITLTQDELRDPEVMETITSMVELVLAKRQTSAT